MVSPDSPPTTPAPTRIPPFVYTIVEVLVFGVVLGIAWKAWSIWPAVPFADPDTWGYLNPALSWLSGLGFHQAGGRDWFYPALLTLFLKTTGSFAGIFAWQKCLGLLAGILMAATWRCWVSLLPFTRGVQLLITLLGALPIYAQLINQQAILFTFSLRPEAVLPLFVYAQLACVMGYVKYRWHTPRALPAILLGAGTIVFAYGCYLLKPSWYLATAVTCIPVFAGLFGKLLPLKMRLLAPATGVVLSLLIFWVPARLLFVRDGASVTLLPLALLYVHAPLVEKSLEARLATMPDSDPEKARLQHLDDTFKSEIRIAEERYGPYEVLRINPDYLLDSHPINAAIFDYAHHDVKEIKNFCFKAYGNAVLNAPGAYTQKVWLQFRYFLFPDAKTFFKDREDISVEYQLTAKALTAHRPTGLQPTWQEANERYEQEVNPLSTNAAKLERHRKLTAFSRSLPRWIPAVEIAFLITLLAAHLWSPLHKLRAPGWAALFLFFAPFGNALGVCFVHALDIYRYRTTYGGYFLFALTAMALFALLVAAQAIYQSVAKSGRQQS
jgi:hypothetical protein